MANDRYNWAGSDEYPRDDPRSPMYWLEREAWAWKEDSRLPGFAHQLVRALDEIEWQYIKGRPQF